MEASCGRHTPIHSEYSRKAVVVGLLGAEVLVLVGSGETLLGNVGARVLGVLGISVGRGGVDGEG